MKIETTDKQWADNFSKAILDMVNKAQVVTNGLSPEDRAKCESEYRDANSLVVDLLLVNELARSSPPASTLPVAEPEYFQTFTGLEPNPKYNRPTAPAMPVVEVEEGAITLLNLLENYIVSDSAKSYRLMIEAGQVKVDRLVIENGWHKLNVANGAILIEVGSKACIVRAKKRKNLIGPGGIGLTMQGDVVDGSKEPSPAGDWTEKKAGNISLKLQGGNGGYDIISFNNDSHHIYLSNEYRGHNTVRVKDLREFFASALREARLDMREKCCELVWSLWNSRNGSEALAAIRKLD